ncbi:MAG: hypothetical protein MR051_05500 [Lentisphaeria bacterium]|nr:hypothetical protein [Lentisphaeria bacterium]
MQNSEWIIDAGDQRIVFDTGHGVMPAAVSLKNFDGGYEPVLTGDRCAFTVTKEDGRVCRSQLAGEPELRDFTDHRQIVFPEVEFIDGSGRVIPELTAAFTYDCFFDGTVFCSFYFLVKADCGYKYRDLKLALGSELSRFDDIRWAILHRREKVDGAMIQDLAPQRNLERGLEMVCPEISPLVSFNAFRPGAEAMYMEFFMEGGASLTGKPGVNTTRIDWKNGSPAVEWNFQNVLDTKPRVCLQLRNFWGWIIKNPPRTRHLPPMTMYHYLDNAVRYPSTAEINAMADSGCDLLILHENWRHDLQNDGIPCDRERFLATVKAAHDRGIRVAVYIRGNENSAVEGSCEWFDRCLKKDFDGLYMDYGGPMCRLSAADENFVNGRIHFRAHYETFRRLRERVGKDGLLFSHTGPCFSGMSMNFFDGYVSGEGERGMLILSRKHHEYYSMAAVATGTMWTAAFPEYSTEKMIPFLAAAGQYPHNPLGEQFPSSSLAHPGEPGINDHVFRPLWKLWGMVRNEKDLRICCDYNSRGVFPAEPECGHHLLVSADGRRALYVVTNFADAERTFDVTFDSKRAGLDPAGKRVWKLSPTLQSPGTETLCSAAKLTVTLPSCGVAGFYFSDGEPDFFGYRRAYHVPCGSGKQFLAQLEEQRRLRENPPQWDNLFLTVGIAPQMAFGYEDSMLLDLFDNDSFVVEFMPDGSLREIAKILRADGKSLCTGDRSTTLDLKQLLPPGRHRLGLQATHLGEPFYSFFKAELSDGNGRSYEIIFRNDLEPDRAFLRFDVLI